MKIIVFVFVICVFIILSQESETNMKDYKLCLKKEYKQACIAENTIEPDRIRLIERNELMEEDMTIKDKCYLSCMLSKNHIVINNWSLNATKFIKALKSDQIIQSVKKQIERISKHSTYKKDCSYGTNVFLDIIRSLKKKNIRFTVVYKGFDVPTPVEYPSCGEY